MKKMLSMALSLSLLLSLVACGGDGSGADTANRGDGKAPENTKPVKILAEITGGKDPDEHILWQKEFSEKSGIPIEMTIVAGDEYPNKLAATLAAGSDYDIIYMVGAQYEKVSGTGLFEPLSSRIKESKVFSDAAAFPQKEWQRITRPDGEIYGIFSKNEGGRVPIIREDWLKKVGLELPDSFAGYEEMVRAFTENDPDGNGKKDTYGLTLSGIYDIQPFMSAYGVADGYAQTADGKWTVPYATEAAIPVYEWLNKLYKAGYLDPNFATNGTSVCREQMLTDKIGVFTYWANWIGIFTDKATTDKPDSTFALAPGKPVLAADGKGMLTAGQDGLWFVMKDSKNKDSAFGALEFLHTDAGMRLLSIGVEGHDYTMENGKPVYTEIGKQHSSDHGANVPKAANYEDPMGRLDAEKQANTLLSEYGNRMINRENDPEEIVTKHAVKAIFGEISAKDAVAAMENELRSKKIY